MENSFLSNNRDGDSMSGLPPKKYLSKKPLCYSFILVTILIIAYFLFLTAPIGFGKDVLANIQAGSSLRGVSLQLKSQNIIRSRIAFEAFVIIYGGEKHLVTGDYLFESRLPVFEVARRIASGEHHLAPVKVTIPEGFDVSEISDTFVPRLINFDKEKFVSEAKPYEGYLFPDTYFFLTTDNQEDVLQYMRKNFDKKIIPLIPDITASGKTEKDIIIMASIIEREAKGEVDREFISGILWNRLKVKMPLEVDAAPITYKERGLPESPVSNPGLAAIRAAISPKNSPYLFYLHDSDGTIHYARTFEEHKANKLKYLKK